MMRSSIITAAGLLALVSNAVAQNSTGSPDYAAGLLSALNSLGLSVLAGAIGALPAAPQIAQTLQAGNRTVFAPNNDAFFELGITGENLAQQNVSFLTNVIQYHVLQGSFPPSALTTNGSTIATTLLSDPEYVQLPGRNASQVLVLKKAANGTTLIASSGEPRVLNATTYRNLEVYVINKVLTIPGNLSTVATEAIPVLASLLTSTNLVAPLEAIRGITVFAPSDTAISAVESNLGSLNATAINNILANHVLNGTVAYSSTLKNGQKVITASGEELEILVQSNGTYVKSGSITARVTATDILVENGVVHLIDQVLVNTNANPQAAASAASVAATATPSSTAGGVIGNNPVASASASASASKAATGGAIPSFSTSFSLVAVIGAVVGGAALFV